MYECHNCGWAGPVPEFDDCDLPICPDCGRAVYLYPNSTRTGVATEVADHVR